MNHAYRVRSMPAIERPRSVIGSLSSPVLLAALLLALHPTATHAQWVNDPAINTPVCTSGGAQLNSVATSDGAGGAFVAWQSGPVGAGDIYAQHFDAAGMPLWAPNGIVICAAAGDQGNPAILADGAGGAFIAWQDARFIGPGLHDIYAQHVTAAGVLTWLPVGGVLVCAAIGETIWPMLVLDGAGGVIITWEDDRGLDYDIYAEHLSAAGALLWAPGAVGLPICVASPGDQYMPMLVTDGAGGAIISWYQDIGPAGNIYAQHVTAAGALTWPPIVTGVPICVVPGEQAQPTIATDGAGGAIITWYDQRPPLVAPDYDVYAQHVSAAGAATWAAGGVLVNGAPGPQTYPKIISDVVGGAILTWQSGPAGASDIYAQRLTPLGAPMWAPLGASVCVMPGAQELPKIISDGAGGAIVSWYDSRVPADFNIYAEHLSPLGAALWGPPVVGTPVCTSIGDQNWAFQFYPMVEDGSGGAIITWTDARPPIAAGTSIYAQLVNADGSIGPQVFDDRVSETFDNSTEWGRAVASAGVAGSAVVGARFSGSSPGVLLSRFGADGDVLWWRAYDVSPFTNEFGSAIVRLSDGWAIAGHTGGGDNPPGPSLDRVPLVMRLDESGDVVWGVSLTAIGGAEARGLALAANGDLIVVGSTQMTVGGSAHPRLFVARLDGTGALVWANVLDAAAATLGLGWGVVETADGDIVVSGIHAVPGALGILLAKLDAAGAALWSEYTTLDANPTDLTGVSALTLTPTGGLAVWTTWMDNSGGGTGLNHTLFAFDADGASLWATDVALGPAMPPTTQGGLSADAAGYFASCPSFDTAQPTALVMRFDTSGGLLWTRRRAVGGGFSADATGLAAAGTTALVTGSIGNDMMLLRVDRAGTGCQLTSVAASATSPALTVTDAGLSSVSVIPGMAGESPTVATLSPLLYECSATVSVPREIVERVSGNGIHVRISSPARSTLACRITVPRKLSLHGRWYDVAGRGVGARLALGELGPGTHSVQLAAPGNASGIYMLALEGGGLRGSTRVVVER